VKTLENLDNIAENIRKDFTAQDAAREKALPLGREVIRYCGNAIRAVHRQEFDQAADMLKTARHLLDDEEKALASGSELHNTGFLRDAQKEYAEGCITLALIKGDKLPDPDALGTEYSAYLNGMGEAVGEIRRYLLDGLRKGDLSRGEELLLAMDDIYNTLVTIDFPDAITGGLRRTTDMIRGVLERTRSDLTLTIQQKVLEDKLDRFKEQMK
jgi:translin